MNADIFRIGRVTALFIFRFLTFSIIATCVQPLFLIAGMRIYPTSVIITSPSRSGTVTVTNVSERDEEVWVEFIYGFQSVNHRGLTFLQIANPDSAGEQSATRWLRAFPQRFLLPANTAQVVRILVSPPAGTVSGEYWGRIVLASKGANPRKVPNASEKAVV